MNSNDLVVRSKATGRPRLPNMRRVRQFFQPMSATNVIEAIDDGWPRVSEGAAGLVPPARIAIAVGSRGISDIVTIVGEVVRRLKDMRCQPFIVPAMGSHGGATAEGQSEVLRLLGISEQTIGAPVCSGMDVVSLGDVEGIPLHLDRMAWEADGIVLINRVKPHTDFTGPIESGLMKLLVIGLGKQTGADYYHRLGVVRGLQETIPTAGRALLSRAKVLFGVAVVENESHEISILRIIPAASIEKEERELLRVARQHLPDLPLDDIDLLIVDEMGKDISGSGLDPNVIGRTSAVWMPTHERPRITRILVRRLTPRSEGNAIGIGMVDAVHRQLMAHVDVQATAINAVTSCSPEDARLPLVFENDSDAIATMLQTIRPHSEEDLRLVYIKNTLKVESLMVSEGCLQHLCRTCDVSHELEQMRFNKEGDLVSPFAE